MARRGPSISVVIPTLNESARIERAIRCARAIGDEVIVVDSGSGDGTADLARDAGAIVIRASRGRGPQLHAGASHASSDVLLFLHADAVLDARAGDAIRDVLHDPRVVGGNFRLRFAPRSFAASLFSFANHVRRRWFGVYYGDSAIFVRRSVYEELGGFRSLPILEDYDFVRRLERRGRTAYVRHVEVEASARRFERAPVRTLFVWTWIQMLHSVLDVSPDRLARHYADIRE